jgi:putative PIN family toxin of toxin-antitoxin system
LSATSIPRLVLDTNAWLDGLVFDDARVAALFASLCAGEVVAVSNPACRDEWRRVLRYPQFALDAARCAELEAAYDALTTRFEPGEPLASTLPRCRDPDDQKFLELARDARAVALLTRDAELLNLSRRAQRDAGFAILLPEAFELRSA